MDLSVPVVQTAGCRVVVRPFVTDCYDQSSRRHTIKLPEERGQLPAYSETPAGIFFVSPTFSEKDLRKHGY